MVEGMPTAVKATDNAASTAPKAAWRRHCGTERIRQQEDECGLHRIGAGIRKPSMQSRIPIRSRC